MIPARKQYVVFAFLCAACLHITTAALRCVAAERPNVLLLCIDDLRPELACFGKTYIHSPNIDQLAARGRAFHHHYVQAPTCGASRFALLTGTYGPSGNGALLQRGGRLAKQAKAAPPSMPAWFRKHGYQTVSVGKVSHHPGGRGGANWDDDSIREMPKSWDRHLMPVGPWKHPRGAMHGLANGEIRIQAGKMDVFQSVDGSDAIYPDGLITDEALRQLDQLTNGKKAKPFFLAVGIIRPHLPFGAPAKYLKHYVDAKLPPIPHPAKPKGKTTWHRSGEFMKYNRWKRNPNQDQEFANEVRKHYAACVSYADAQVGRILDRLKTNGVDKKTLVVLWGDHGWHLGEHAIWGKHSLFEESLRSPLIISQPGMEAPGEPSQAIVESIDLFPSLCDLAGLPTPDFLDGKSLRPNLEKPDAEGHDAVSYSRARTIRTKTHRLVAHQDGHAELYDHRLPDAETKNIADANPRIVRELLSRLKQRLEGDADFAPKQDMLPVAPPAGATVLFRNRSQDRFLSMSGGMHDWPIEEGEIVSTRGKGRTNHLVSAFHFRDADIHVEFKLPESGTGNSGVYIHGNYELQIHKPLDSKELSQQEMGAVYGFAAPLQRAARKPGEWQVLDIRYRAPRRDADQAITTRGSITAWLNGRRVQNNTRVGEPRSSYHPFRYGVTPYLKKIWAQQKTTAVGPLFLQDHDNPVRFRNVWVLPLDDKAKMHKQ